MCDLSLEMTRMTALLDKSPAEVIAYSWKTKNICLLSKITPFPVVSQAHCTPPCTSGYSESLTNMPLSALPPVKIAHSYFCDYQEIPLRIGSRSDKA